MRDMRKKLDKIDRKLIKLLKKRFAVCKKIGKYKKKNGLPVQDLKREKQIMNNRAKKSGLSKDFVQKLFKLIFKESKKVQKK